MFQYFKLKKQVEKLETLLAIRQIDVLTLRAENTIQRTELKNAEERAVYFEKKYYECICRENTLPAFSEGSKIGHIHILEVLPPAEQTMDLMLSSLLAVGCIGLAMWAFGRPRPGLVAPKAKERRYRYYDEKTRMERIVTETELLEILPLPRVVPPIPRAAPVPS